jgi:hypothetical protein
LSIQISFEIAASVRDTTGRKTPGNNSMVRDRCNSPGINSLG